MACTFLWEYTKTDIIEFLYLKDKHVYPRIALLWARTGLNIIQHFWVLIMIQCEQTLCLYWSPVTRYIDVHNGCPGYWHDWRVYGFLTALLFHMRHLRFPLGLFVRLCMGFLGHVHRAPACNPEAPDNPIATWNLFASPADSTCSQEFDVRLLLQDTRWFDTFCTRTPGRRQPGMTQQIDRAQNPCLTCIAVDAWRTVLGLNLVMYKQAHFCKSAVAAEI